MRVVNGRSSHRIHLPWLLLVLVAQPLSAAKIYQYTNSAGETVFTDERVEGATVHEVEDAPVIPMKPVDVPEPPEDESSSKEAAEPRMDTSGQSGQSEPADGANEQAQGRDGSGSRAAEDDGASSGYQHLAIVEPADGEVASRLQGSISVELVIQPDLRGGDRIRILVDGEPRVRDSTGRRHLINGLAPGKHELVAQIHRDDEVVKESPPVRFQLMVNSQ
ncbi:MAG: DUF4124 domain-containing protein [Guyparkeria sp.]